MNCEKTFGLVLSLMALLGWCAVVQANAEYIGDDKCKMCHAGIYDTYIKTGHPYKIQKINGGPPSYPPGTSSGVPKPPKGMSWNDVTYVIGGYGWKARFMDKEGYILTGDKDRQYNLANADIGTETNWTGYSAKTAPRKPYDKCGTCHTTGWTVCPVFTALGRNPGCAARPAMGREASI